jgi:predicted amidohydrolase YtcJ
MAGLAAGHWRHLIPAILVGLVALGCAPADDSTGDTAGAGDAASTIYTGGDIVTVNDAQPTAEAVAVRDGIILAVGSSNEVMSLRGESTEVVDLDGKTLLPGFVDAHGHLKNVGFQALAADLLPPPDSDVDTIDRLQEKLRDWGEGEISQALGWIIGFGYDDAQLAEQRHPTREDLDAVSTDRPVFIIHQSGHLYSCNSVLLELAGITADTEDPPGGVIRRQAGSREPDGVLEETAVMQILGVFPQVDEAGARRMVREGIAAYTRFGFTTASESRAFPSDLDLYAALAEAGELEIDVLAYPDF